MYLLVDRLGLDNSFETTPAAPKYDQLHENLGEIFRGHLFHFGHKNSWIEVFFLCVFDTEFVESKMMVLNGNENSITFFGILSFDSYGLMEKIRNQEAKEPYYQNSRPNWMLFNFFSDTNTKKSTF